MARNRADEPARPRARGFEPAFRLVAGPLRAAGKARGFASSRLFTHWAEVVGADLAPLVRPVRVGRDRGGLGATLTLALMGATGPVVEMQKERIRARVNAAYGYNAIARIALTQAGAFGLAEGAAPFAPAPPGAGTGADTGADTGAGGHRPDAATRRLAEDTASGVSDDGLRAALERLGENILTRPRRK